MQEKLLQTECIFSYFWSKPDILRTIGAYRLALFLSVFPFVCLSTFPAYIFSNSWILCFYGLVLDCVSCSFPVFDHIERKRRNWTRCQHEYSFSIVITICVMLHIIWWSNWRIQSSYRLGEMGEIQLIMCL